MKKFIPIEKQSKKAQKAYHSQMRGSWNGVNPVTRSCPDRTKFHKAERSQAKSTLRAAY